MAQVIVQKNSGNRAFSALILNLGLIAALFAGLVTTAPPAAAAVYAITWDDNGATTPSSGGQATYNTDLTSEWAAPSTRPIKDGYIFGGWYTLASGGTKAFGPTNIRQNFRPSAPTTLYAQWGDDIIWDNQGGTTDVAGPASFLVGSPVGTLPTVSREYYNFAGWFDSDSGGTEVTDSFIPSNTNGEGVRFYARWEALYGITWDDNGADEGHWDGQITYIPGGAIDETPSAPPHKNGYTFDGYFTQITGGDRVTTALLESTNYRPTEPYAPVTFYARWISGDNSDEEDVQYSVQWDHNEADEVESGGLNYYLSGSAITFPTTDPIKISYTFLGWCSVQELPGETCSGVFVTNRSYTPAAPFGPITFFALWGVGADNEPGNEPVNLTVTYNSQGGSSISNGSTATGGSIGSSPGTPTRNGHIFRGWFEAETGGSAITFPYTHAQTTNFTLFAQWAPVSSDASLSGLELRNSQDSVVSFSPALFSPSVKNYTADVSSSTSGMRITPTLNQADASITINGQPSLDIHFQINTRWFPNLNIGSNTFTIVVTAQDGTTTSTYTVTVTRASGIGNPDNTITWDNQGATVASSGGSTTYTNGSSVSTIPTTAPQKSGHRFVGWFTGATSGTQITNGSFTPKSPYSNVTFYAHWTVNRSSSVGTWDWANQSSAGLHKWHALAASADGSKLFAGVDDGGSIYRSTDFGTTWSVIAGTSGKNWFSIASNIDGTKVAAVARGGHIWTSTDSGSTWTQRSVGAVRNWESIASSSDGLKLVAVASNGDSNGFIYTSSNGGLDWSSNLAPAGTNKFSGVASSNNGTHLAVSTWANGIYTSTNSGQSWTARTLPVPYPDAVTHIQAIASSGDGSRLVTGSRITGSINGGVIFTSVDYGVSWKAYAQNSYDYINFTSNGDGSRLAAAIYGQSGVNTSADFGATWTFHSNEPRGQIAIASNVDGSLLFLGGYGGNIWTGRIPNARIAAVLPTSTSTTLSRSANTPAVALSFSASNVAAPAVTVTPIANPIAEASTPFNVAQASIFDISVVNITGQVTVCVDGGPDVKLWHYTNGAWVDITTSHTSTQTCGLTSSFSPFATGPVVPVATPPVVTPPVVTPPVVTPSAQAAAAAVERESEKQVARTEIMSKINNPKNLTVDSFVKAGIPGVTAGNIAALQTELLALPESARADITQVLKVVRKFEVVGNIASDSIKNIPSSQFVEIGLIPAASKNKVALVSAIRKLPASARGSYAEIKAAIDAETVKIKARSERTAAIAARNKAR